MKRFGLCVGFFSALMLSFPVLLAQDKKEPKQAEKKDDDDEKDKKKKPAPKKEKLEFGAKFVTKILSIKAESNREIVIETQEVDPQRVFDLKNWQAQRSQQLAQQQFNALRQQNPQQRFQQLQNYQWDVVNFKIELAKRQQNIYRAKPVDVIATEDAKVRTLVPPIEFDDQGNQKKWTKKELEERRDKTGLPGFPVEFDSLRPGQFIEIYMKKVAAAPKTKKKGPQDDDVPMFDQNRAEFIMVVILK